MPGNLPVPEEYELFKIDEVRPLEGRLMIRYGGHRMFQGVMRDWLQLNDLEGAVKPGTEIIVRYHTAETGNPGQVAHMLMPHPTQDGWAEIYADWE